MSTRIQHLLCKSQQVLLGIPFAPVYAVEMNLGRRLKQARDARGLGQEDLAQKVPGASQPMISALENRDSETTTLLFGFADALGVSPRWLQDGDGESGLETPIPVASPLQERLSPEELALVRAYRDVAPTHKMTVQNIMFAISRGGARDFMSDAKWSEEDRRNKYFDS